MFIKNKICGAMFPLFYSLIFFPSTFFNSLSTTTRTNVSSPPYPSSPHCMVTYITSSATCHYPALTSTTYTTVLGLQMTTYENVEITNIRESGTLNIWWCLILMVVGRGWCLVVAWVWEKKVFFLKKKKSYNLWWFLTVTNCDLILKKYIYFVVIS